MSKTETVLEEVASDSNPTGQMAFTPGPWNYAPTGPVMAGYCQPFAIGDITSLNLIAGCFGDVKGGEETAKANARLIAAAPELLEACKEIISAYSEGKIKYCSVSESNALLAFICDAVNKAEGRA